MTDEEWKAIVRKYELAAPEDITEFVGYNSMVYADMVVSGGRRQGNTILNSTIAARQAGFHDCIDTEDMFVSLFARMVEKQLLPPAP